MTDDEKKLTKDAKGKVAVVEKKPPPPAPSPSPSPPTPPPPPKPRLTLAELLANTQESIDDDKP